MLDGKPKSRTSMGRRGAPGATGGSKASPLRRPRQSSAPEGPDSADPAPGSPPPSAAGPRSAATRDPHRTSAAILRAAIAEFTEMGLGGARIDRIAERAGINKRMLYHYFGDKEALYARALKEIYLGIRNAERELGLERLDPVAGIRRLATFTWDYFLAHPEFLSLLATENLNRAAFLRKTDWGGEVNSPLVAGLADLLRRGAEAGLFRPGLDPAEVYVTMTGVGYFALSNRHTLAVAFDRDFGGAPLAGRWGEHMADVVLAWLAAPAGAAVGVVETAPPKVAPPTPGTPVSSPAGAAQRRRGRGSRGPGEP